MYSKADAATPEAYIDSLEEPRKSSIRTIHELMLETVPDFAVMGTMKGIDYGSYHYKYASGREGEWPVFALVSQKQYISFYVCAVRDGRYIADYYRDRLPKADIGKSCVRFKKIEDIDLSVFKEMVEDGAESMRKSNFQLSA